MTKKNKNKNNLLTASLFTYLWIYAIVYLKFDMFLKCSMI